MLLEGLAFLFSLDFDLSESADKSQLSRLEPTAYMCLPACVIA